MTTGPISGGCISRSLGERIFADDCTHVPSPEALDAVYRRPCSCASIRHHARSSFANSGKFTKFKCKIGRCSAGSMEARARWRSEVARGRDEGRERRTEDTRDRKIDIGARSVRASEKGVVGARRRGGSGTGRKCAKGTKREAKSSSENGIYR